MVGKSRRPKRRKTQTSPSLSAATHPKVIALDSRYRQGERPGTTATLTPPAPPRRATTAKRRTPRTARQFRLKLPRPILYPLRLLIVGAGISVCIGTVLTAANFRTAPLADLPEAASGTEQRLNPELPPATPEALPLATPLTQLAATTQAAIASEPTLDASLLFVDLDTGEYLDVAGDRALSAASTIKIPILVAFLEAVDKGEVNLDDTLTMTQEVIGGGSGGMQYKTPGSTYSALYTATEMSVNSDNTATNMIIEVLGGNTALNAKFQQWGMAQTQVNNPLPDLEGTNLTSAKDLAHLLARINQGEILSMRSRDRLFRIMGATSNDRLLPQSLGQGADIVHKTGDIGTIIGDAGIIDLPNGKRYVAAIFVERPYNDPKGRELLHKISRQFYDHMEKVTPEPIIAEPPPETEAPTQ
ncbi:beta-lactamase, putative [[Synechococcus] sp. NIES-970]|nr:beta-lactamase, putative [[Synechococcus] sp. NIES-970]